MSTPGAKAAPSPWRASEALDILRDSVAADRLVILSGAGVSMTLRRAADSTKRLPGWLDLLKGLLDELASAMLPRDREDCDHLLQADPPPSSRHLIAAASLIRRADPSRFDRQVRAMTLAEPDTYSDTHRDLLRLRPRGIITLNYDRGHESACEKEDVAYRLLTQDSEPEFAQWIGESSAELFVLKAHGTLESGPLVLSGETYREAMRKRPAYRAFLQHVLANYHLLIIGFGMDDPDFADFTMTLSGSFGVPVHQHVAIRRVTDFDREDVLQRRLLGIHSLYLLNYGELPEVFDLAKTTAGPWLRSILHQCLDSRMSERRCGHAELPRLGPAGRAVANEALWKIGGHALADGDNFRLAEVCYTLGLVDAEANKARLFDLIDGTVSADVIGRALTVLRPAFREDDLARLESWRTRFASGLRGKNPERIVKYIEYLQAYVPSKFASDPPPATEP